MGTILCLQGQQKGSDCMSEKEKEIIKKLSDTIPKLDDSKKNYILGVAEGMAMVRESEKADRKEQTNE